MSKAKGLAVYTEFVQNDKTYQFIITSEAVTTSNAGTPEIVPVAMLTRQISTDRPRAQWRVRSSATKSKLDSTGAVEKLPSSSTPEQIAEAGRLRIDPHLMYLKGMITGGWTMVEESLIIEVSAADYERIRDLKAPEALIRRVVSARLDAGFPADLFPAAKL